MSFPFPHTPLLRLQWVEFSEKNTVHLCQIRLYGKV